MGVASGRALCVVIGNETRREYMVMGDSINVAARLSTSGDGSERVLVLCDEATAEATRRRIEYGPPVELRVKGKTCRSTRTARSDGAGRPPRRAPPRSAAVANSGCCGRRSKRASAAARARSPSMPNPGMGKSHLLAEAAELAAGRGMRCLFGSGDAIEQATPYHGWRHVFAALLNIDDRAQSGEREMGAVLAMGARAPLLNLVLGLNLADTPETAVLQNERRIQATRQFLLELLAGASTPPLLIALDDAQWLDSASWALVRESSAAGSAASRWWPSARPGTLVPSTRSCSTSPARRSSS